jgi:hypothetical protein
MKNEIKVAVAILLGHFDIDSVDTADSQEPHELMAFAMSPVGLRMRLSWDKKAIALQGQNSTFVRD